MEIKCAYCKGSGKKYGERGGYTDKCPVCYGAGKVDIPSGSNTTECSYCSGSGKKYGEHGGYTDICPTCNGIGVAYKRKFE